MRATDGKCKLMRSNQTWLRKNAFHRTKQKRCLNVYIHVLIHYVSTPLHITLRLNTICQHLHLSLHHYITTQYSLSVPFFFFFWITFSISMYIMCVCLFSALSRRVGALQISIIIIITRFYQYNNYDDPLRQYTS